jgi:HK97 family phage major capsid protein
MLTEAEKNLLALLDAKTSRTAEEETTRAALIAKRDARPDVPDTAHNRNAELADLHKRFTALSDADRAEFADKYVTATARERDRASDDLAIRYPDGTATPSPAGPVTRDVAQAIYDRPARTDEERSIHCAGSLLNLAAPIIARNAGITIKEAQRAILESESFRRKFAAELAHSPTFRAMYGSSSTAGGVLIPTGLSATLTEAITVKAAVFSAFPTFEQPTPTFDIPYEATSPTLTAFAEPTSDTQSNYTAASNTVNKVTATAKWLGILIWVSELIDADSAVAVQPMLEALCIRQTALGLDEAAVSGDTTNPHQDSDTTYGSTDRRAQWIGLRKMAQSAAKQSLATFTGENVAAIQGLMGAPGSLLSDNVWIVGLKGMGKLLFLRDAQNNPLYLTMDKIGPAAAAITGQVGSMFGSPVILASAVRENLNASGVYDGSTTTKGILIYAHKPAILTGNMNGGSGVKVFERPERGQLGLRVMVRKSFTSLQPYASVYVVGLGYNWAV